MAVATFDTLKFADTLKAAGVPAAQAEGQARAFAEVIQLNFKELATKDDLAAVRVDLERLAERFKRDLVEESLKLSARIDKHETKTDWQFTLLRWMLGLSIALSTGVAYRLFFGKPFS